MSLKTLMFFLFLQFSTIQVQLPNHQTNHPAALDH